MSVFARLAPRLQQAIVARLGWSSLRPVQELAGEALLDGRNAVVLAPTAGGKTEASMFPALSGLVERPCEGVGALYVAPIKALLNNQAERLGLYTEMVGLRRFVWHGDVPSNERRAFLRDPAELLMTTPESLEVMLVSPKVDAGKLFGDLRVVVVDEVHALAGTDRGGHLMSVIERLAAISRHDVQRVGLSATVGNPARILEWIRGSSGRSGVVVDPPKAPARRQILVVHRDSLPELAHDAAQRARGQKSLFFCQTRRTTEAVAEQMRRFGTEVFVHHSAVSREERQLAEERFHHGGDACIVCTSTLELGIDVGDLDRVLQAEAPASVGSFLQRMGRTGRRAGQAANTTFLCETADGVLQAIALVELARAGWVEDVPVQTRCWPVLVHHETAASVLADRRAAFADVLSAGRGGLEETDEEIRWWTFAGGRVNSTLRSALLAVNADWKVVPDNFVVKVRGAARPAFSEALERLSSLELWEDERLWSEVMEGLPNYRLSKFQPLMPAWVEREMLAASLLDIAGAWRWLSAGGVARVDLAAAAGRIGEAALPTRAAARPSLPVGWVRSPAELVSACARLRTYEVVGLDVETTLDSRALCLVQLAVSDEVVIVDALEVDDLAPLGALLADRACTKVIHNAVFERTVLGRHGIAIEPVFDTLAASRARHGRQVDGGHGLAAVCAREIGLVLGKSQQTRDWTRRPLSEAQAAYAALDAEVPLRLHAALRSLVVPEPGVRDPA